MASPNHFGWTVSLPHPGVFTRSPCPGTPGGSAIGRAWARRPGLPEPAPAVGVACPCPLVDVCGTGAQALVAGWSPAPHWSLSSRTGMFPGKGGMVAPGMTCQYVVQFFPNCLGDFDDFILVETQSSHRLLIPLQARRPPPVLTSEWAPCPPPPLPGMPSGLASPPVSAEDFVGPLRQHAAWQGLLGPQQGSGYTVSQSQTPAVLLAGGG